MKTKATGRYIPGSVIEADIRAATSDLITRKRIAGCVKEQSCTSARGVRSNNL